MTASSQAPAGRDISVLVGVLRRRGWIVVLAVLVAAGAAYVYANREEPRYEASATLLLQEPPSGPLTGGFGTPTPNTAPDREALVLAAPVKARAIRALTPKLGSRAAAVAAVAAASASSAAESKVVTLTGSARVPTTAARVANALAEQNIAHRKASSLRAIHRAQAVAQAALDKLRPVATRPENGPALNQARATLQGLNQAAGAQDGDAQILQRAVVPSSPASPRPRRAALIGGFAGLLLGFAVALVLEQFDRRLKRAEDLGNTFDLPVLASVPTSRALAKRGAKDVDALPPAEREAFQMLRANLRFLNTERELHSVVVTSAASGDGKTTVALNLARADASVGRNVILIEADMRRPSIASLLGFEGTRGLAAYLERPDAKLADVVRRVPVTHHANGSAPLTMDVLVAGEIPSNPSELINSERMRALIDEAERAYDLVVIDTSPVGIVADAIPLMSESSAVIVVSRVGRITSVEAKALRAQLERIDAPAFGLVANFAGSRDKGYGYY